MEEKQKKELKAAVTKHVEQAVMAAKIQNAVASGIPFAKIIELVTKYGPMVIPIIEDIMSLVNQNQNPPVLKNSKGESNG